MIRKMNVISMIIIVFLLIVTAFFAGCKFNMFRIKESSDVRCATRQDTKLCIEYVVLKEWIEDTTTTEKTVNYKLH